MKKSIKLIAIGALIGASSAFAANMFWDVQQDAWYAGAVERLAAKGIINGYEDGSFRPNSNVNRAELAVMMDRLVEKIESGSISNSSSSLVAYKSSKLNLGFNFPKEWGNVENMVEPDHIALMASGADSNIFLGADNGGESPGRGGYWGDSAEDITDQNYINSLCSKMTDVTSCVMKTNAAGVKYAKVVRNHIDSMEGPETSETFYYIYNPYSSFRGIIASAVRLKKTDKDAEAKMETLIDSLYFVK